MSHTSDENRIFRFCNFFRLLALPSVPVAAIISDLKAVQKACLFSVSILVDVIARKIVTSNCGVSGRTLRNKVKSGGDARPGKMQKRSLTLPAGGAVLMGRQAESREIRSVCGQRNGLAGVLCLWRRVATQSPDMTIKSKQTKMTILLNLLLRKRVTSGRITHTVIAIEVGNG